MNEHWVLWAVFGAVTAAMMALDLSVLQRTPHQISFREAIRWTLAWIAVAAAFVVFLYYSRGADSAGEFVTCYLTEYALSVDNMFVFLVIFAALGVPAESQRRVLMWGIVGALVMRGVFILAGAALVSRFAWTAYVLGGFLVLTAIRLVVKGDEEVDPKKNPLLRFSRRYLRTTEEFEGKHFFVRRDSRSFATPLFITLLVIESTDILFAVDSVPAALGITQDATVLYTSNILAILGLRSLFFAVQQLIQYVRYLNWGLSAILAFVGLKMIVAPWFHVSISTSLAVVGGILALSIVVSSIANRISPRE